MLVSETWVASQSVQQSPGRCMGLRADILLHCCGVLLGVFVCEPHFALHSPLNSTRKVLQPGMKDTALMSCMVLCSGTSKQREQQQLRVLECDLLLNGARCTCYHIADAFVTPHHCH